MEKNPYFFRESVKEWWKMIYKMFFLFGIFFINLSASESFIIQELGTGKIIQQKGDLSSSFSPCCTFNIALSLMGYEEKILQDEKEPLWPYNEKYQAFIETWKAPHNPITWMQHSCVWYSQELTKHLGREKFQQYVKLFHYGNEDVSKEDSLTHSWLGSTLKISPLEQISFLECFLTQQFSLSSHAYEMTKKILYLETFPNGWNLYGKTGTGFLSSGFQMGWFVGFVTKEENAFLIVCLIQDDRQEDSLPAGSRAKNKVRNLFISGNIL